MNLTKLLPKKNKKGVTLVELIIGVVVLSIFTLGIIASLSAANAKIAKNAQEAANHSEAVQMMDTVIAALSHGGYSTPTDVVNDLFGASAGVSLVMDSSKYTYKVNPAEPTSPTLILGWDLKLTYKNVTVIGYASNTEGVFDKREEVE